MLAMTAEKRPSEKLLGSGDAGSSRTITLIILVVLVLGLAIAFYQVMIGFLLPLFLATLLTILFQPLHERIQRACRHHDRLAAALTTLAILLIVLAPIGYVLFRAATEAFALLLQPGGPQFDRATLDRLVTEVNQHFGLDLSASESDQNRGLECAGRIRPPGGKDARRYRQLAGQRLGDGLRALLFLGRWA